MDYSDWERGDEDECLYVKINNGANYQSNRLTELEKMIEDMKNEVAEMILLESGASEAVSAYDMSYEEYMELHGQARL